MSAQRLLPWFVSVAALAASGTAASQGFSAPKPAKTRSYLGLNLTRPAPLTPTSHCGATAITCESDAPTGQLYAGSMVGNFWGVEMGVLNLGLADRAARAQGVNLSLVGRAPIGRFGLYGKLGTTYGRTEVSSGAAALAGSESGFGWSYGAGVSYDFTPRLSATLGWDSWDFRFAGGSRDPVRGASMGLQYRY
jgi:OmpA-OmpF porin, OOP family